MVKMGCRCGGVKAMAKLVTARTVTWRTRPDRTLLLDDGGWKGFGIVRGPSVIACCWYYGVRSFSAPKDIVKREKDVACKRNSGPQWTLPAVEGMPVVQCCL